MICPFDSLDQSHGAARRVARLAVLHYFSDDEGILAKTRETLRVSRKLGNRAIVPTIVLAEFYAQTFKRTGKEIADKHFREVVNSGLQIMPFCSLCVSMASVVEWI